MPTITLLCGLPGSGKSTYREKHATGTVISSDDFIEQAAIDQGKTYNEVFADMIGEADDYAKLLLSMALTQGEDIIVDRTNLTAKKRRSILSNVPKTYKKVAVVFILDPDVLKERLRYREETTGKHIPGFVIESMRAIFEVPTLAEFDEIILFQED